MSKKDMKISVVSYEQTQEEDYKPPSAWYFLCATGQLIYIHCRNRKDAVEYVKNEWNGKYSVRASGLQKTNKPLTVRATETRIKKL